MRARGPISFDTAAFPGDVGHSTSTATFRWRRARHSDGSGCGSVRVIRRGFRRGMHEAFLLLLPVHDRRLALVVRARFGRAADAPALHIAPRRPVDADQDLILRRQVRFHRLRPSIARVPVLARKKSFFPRGRGGGDGSEGRIALRRDAPGGDCHTFPARNAAARSYRRR